MTLEYEEFHLASKQFDTASVMRFCCFPIKRCTFLSELIFVLYRSLKGPVILLLNGVVSNTFRD